MSNSNKCANCGSLLNSEALYCTNCGTRISRGRENYCINPDCISHKKGYSLKASDTYCDMCGKPTFLGEQALKNT